MIADPRRWAYSSRTTGTTHVPSTSRQPPGTSWTPQLNRALTYEIWQGG